MARKRRARCEVGVAGEPPKGGERGVSGGGAKRRTAMRVGEVCGRAAGDGRGATEQRWRKDGVLPSAPASASAQRATASVGARDRHRKAKTAQRASWSRAGRSRARRNRARRPVRRTGRAPLYSSRTRRRSGVANRNGWGAWAHRRGRGLVEQGLKGPLGGGAGCDPGKSKDRGSCRRCPRPFSTGSAGARARARTAASGPAVRPSPAWGGWARSASAHAPGAAGAEAPELTRTNQGEASP